MHVAAPERNPRPFAPARFPRLATLLALCVLMALGGPLASGALPAPLREGVARAEAPAPPDCDQDGDNGTDPNEAQECVDVERPPEPTLTEEERREIRTEG